MYVAIRCPRCGELMLAKAHNRTRACPRCGYRAFVSTLQIYGRAETPNDAAELLRKLKLKENGAEDYKPTFRHLYS